MESAAKSSTFAKLTSFVLLLSFILLSFGFGLNSFFVHGQTTRFTSLPPSPLYVLNGTTAMFNWSYFVANRESEFTSLSPKWSFYDESDTEFVIANDEKISTGNWVWKIVNTCPARLLTRVSKGSNATLVISDVTTDDNGVYGCTLVFKLNPVITKKAELVVTVTPKITIIKDKDVELNGNWTANCSAFGPPTPNITWTKKDNNVIKSAGVEFAILKIVKFTKDQEGTYVCHAFNNPNEQPVKQEIMVKMKYPPVFNESLSSDNLTEACIDKEVTLKCVAEGYPPVNYTWYINGKLRGSGSVLTIDKVKSDDFGNWTCKITNGIKPDILHKVELKEKSDCQNEDGSKGALTTEEKVGIAVGVILIVVGLILIIVVVCKRVLGKKKGTSQDDDAGWTTKEKVVIVIGGLLIIAGVIIIIVIVVS